MTVYLVIEDEPDTGTDFPSVVLDVYSTYALAEARVMEERKKRGLEDDEAYENAGISWPIEPHEVIES